MKHLTLLKIYLRVIPALLDVLKKPSLSKVVKSSIVTNYHTCRPRVFTYCHKHHTMGEVFTRKGINEPSVLMDSIKTMVMREVLVAGVNIYFNLSTFLFGKIFNYEASDHHIFINWSKSNINKVCDHISKGFPIK